MKRKLRCIKQWLLREDPRVDFLLIAALPIGGNIICWLKGWPPVF